MKKIILLFLLVINISFALEITSIDPIDFGTIVIGEKQVSLKNVGVYVDGRSGKEVEIVVPETFTLDGNEIAIKVREKTIILDDDGIGKFILDLDLNLEKIEENETLTDNLSIKVKYVKK
jgi:hypothetical protein